jgi:hypothetical protein
MKLNKPAALKSASWGMFQILGVNYGSCGYSNIDAFVEDMKTSEKNHLVAFLKFIKKRGVEQYLNKIIQSGTANSAIRMPYWQKFAYGYNGPGYAQNDYHNKLERAFVKYRMV